MVTSLLVILALIFVSACDSGGGDPPPLLKAESTPDVVMTPQVARVEASSAPAKAFTFVEPGRDTVRGHVLSIPTGFQTDGAYDLVIHFHGNTEAVIESYKLAQIRAVLVIVNLGEGADKYERAFASPAALSRVRRRVNDKLKARGVPSPKLRRMAFSAWSAGYGAVMRVIDQPDHRKKLDAVLLFDGLHAGYAGGSKTVAEGDVAPFVRYGEHAALGDVLFFITHSLIQPENPALASCKETSEVIIQRVGTSRKKTTAVVKPRMLEAVKDIYAERSMLALEARSVAIQGELYVVEYSGRSPLHHVAHLLQMSQIGLPRLAYRWRRPS